MPGGLPAPHATTATSKACPACSRLLPQSTPPHSTSCAPRDAKDPDTLANLTVVGLHLGKNVSRYTA